MITACNELSITVSTPPPQTLVGGARHLMQKGFFLSLSKKNSANRHHALLLYVLPFRFVQILPGEKKKEQPKEMTVQTLCIANCPSHPISFQA